MSQWKLPAFETKPSLTKIVDTEFYFVFQDSGKKLTPGKGPYGALLSKFKKTESFGAGPSSLELVWFAGKKGASSVLFAGCGVPSDVTEERLRILGGNLWSKVSAEKLKSAGLSADSLVAGLPKGKLDPLRAVAAVVEGFALAAYQINHRKTGASAKEHPSSGFKLTVVARDKKLSASLAPALKRISAVAEAVRITRDWSNEPSNFGTPEFFAEDAKRIAKTYGLKYRVLSEKDAEKEKMGLFLGVGQGAEREGKIVVLEYTPAKSSRAKTICLVGKGVTFDSGGISIKPSMRMEDMKHDMTGAATLAAATALAAQWKIQNRVIAVLAFTENMPDGHAIQPGNVIQGRNGKTVEIINTDAEGRLILADVLDYAQDMNPDVVVDAATLTGAVSIALGRQCCALLGNDPDVNDEMKMAAEEVGERVWELPLYEEYFDDLKSDYADMKNSANDSYGGTIRGAIFLKQFIRKGTKWAHLDIAAMAYSLPQLAYFPKKGASGAFVRTVATFCEKFGTDET